MAGPSRISPFQRLPQELQTIIYTATLEPRVIPLSEKPVPIRPRVHQTPPNPIGHFHISGDGVYPYRIQSPVIMSVCKESRAVALKCGYQIWTFKYPAWGGTRHLAWKPSVDTILFEHDDPFKFFEGIFPHTLHLVKNMAVKSSLWHWNSQSETRMLFSLMKFEALQEFVVIVEDKHEEICSEQKARYTATTNESWKLPQDLEHSLLEAKRGLMLSLDQTTCSQATEWSLPRVRIVRSEEDIVKGVSIETKTRGLRDDL